MPFRLAQQAGGFRALYRLAVKTQGDAFGTEQVSDAGQNRGVWPAMGALVVLFQNVVKINGALTVFFTADVAVYVVGGRLDHVRRAVGPVQSGFSVL